LVTASVVTQSAAPKPVIRPSPTGSKRSLNGPVAVPGVRISVGVGARTGATASTVSESANSAGTPWAPISVCARGASDNVRAVARRTDTAREDNWRPPAPAAFHPLKGAPPPGPPRPGRRPDIAHPGKVL